MRALPDHFEENIMFKRILSSLLASACLIGFIGALTGCNTMEGAGKDLERGGEEIQEQAK
jgi:entericidin B